MERETHAARAKVGTIKYRPGRKLVNGDEAAACVAHIFVITHPGGLLCERRRQPVVVAKVGTIK